MKLNLGCGSKILPGWTNLDKFETYKPDVVHDLEVFPYPFEDNSVDEIILSHVLEHIGQVPDVFNNIIKEIYRICRKDALIHISVPHPRHDDFVSDPTHVRPITILGLSLYDKELNKIWEEKKAANTPFGFILDVNFKIISANYILDKKYNNLLKEKKVSQEEIEDYSNKFNNVIKEIKIEWKVIK